MRYAIGDIHGGSATFRALLAALNLRHDDRLILMGDYVDRGRDSKGVLDTIIGLTESGYNVTPLLGNHEDMMIQAITDPSDNFSRAWFDHWGESFGVATPSEVPEQYLNFLKSLPLIVVEHDLVFVHAGLAFDTPDPIADSEPYQMLWAERGIPDRHRLGGRAVVTGHHIKSLRKIRRSLHSDRIFLDNGAFTDNAPGYGNLVAINLDTRELILQPWLDGMSIFLLT